MSGWNPASARFVEEAMNEVAASPSRDSLHAAGCKTVDQVASGRVLFVAPEPVYEDRGTPIAVRHVLRALSELGWEIDLLTYPVGRCVDLPGMRTIRVGERLGWKQIPIGLSGKKVVLDILLTQAMWRLLRTRAYDCVHAVEEAAFPAALLAGRSRTPVIYDMQSSLPEQLVTTPPFHTRLARRLTHACERWLVGAVDAVACSSGLWPVVRGIHQDVPVEEWRFPGSVSDVQPEAVKLLRSKLNLAPGTRVVLYAGNFEQYQGLPLLISAMERVVAVRPNVALVLVGAWSRSDYMIAAGSGLEARDAVRVVPRQPRGDMNTFLSMADVLVSMRALGGNAPLKVFDYLAAGKPIVGIDCPAHRSVLDGHCAALVPPGVESLAWAIGGLLRDDDWASALAAEARRLSIEQFGWQAFKCQVARLYGHAVGAPAEQRNQTQDHEIVRSRSVAPSQPVPAPVPSRD